MTPADLEKWITDNFLVKQGEKLSHYCRWETIPGEAPREVTFRYKIIRLAVRDPKSRLDAWDLLAEEIKKILGVEAITVPAAHLNPGWKPTLSVRAPLDFKVVPYVEYDLNRRLDKFEVAARGALIPAGWEHNVETNAYHPVLKKGVYEVAYFRYLIEYATHQPCHGDIGSVYLHADPVDPTPVIYGFDPGHTHDSSGIMYGGYAKAHDDRVDACAYVYRQFGTPIRTGDPVIVSKKHSGMTEAKYADLIAMQDAPKVDRQTQVRVLKWRANLAKQAAPEVKKAPPGIIGWV